MSMHPKEFAFADDALAEAVGLPPREDGWGLLYCINDLDLRYTLAGSGDFLRTLLDLPPGHDVTKAPTADSQQQVGCCRITTRSVPAAATGLA
jgi:hypothetical protein